MMRPPPRRLLKGLFNISIGNWAELGEKDEKKEEEASDRATKWDQLSKRLENAL